MTEGRSTPPTVEELLLGVDRPRLPEQTRAAHRALLRAEVRASVPALTQSLDTAADGTAAPDPGLLTGLRSAGRGRGPRNRRRGVVIVVAALTVTLAGGGLAAAYLARATPSEEVFVRCFAVASTSFDDPLLSFDVAQADPVDPGAVEQSTAQVATEVCAGVWFRGELSTTEPHIPAVPSGGGSPVPPLQACVLPAGFVGVFPGPAGTCAALGLPESDASPP
jgi:hypothetical protein